MKQLASALVTIDGESKVGSTTVATSIATEAEFQGQILPDLIDGKYWPLNEGLRDDFIAMNDSYNFNNVTKISAGNYYRAAAWLLVELEKQNIYRTEFFAGDSDDVRELLARDGAIEFLQEDPVIDKRVSKAGAMVGIHSLCSTIFCDEVVQAYQADGGANLVIADARDPVGHLRRNDRLGSGAGLVNPASILPLYVHTPIEIAAERMGGNLQEKIAHIKDRRNTDRTRDELPVTLPDNLVHNFEDYWRQLDETRAPDDVIAPFYLENSRDIELDNIQYLAGIIAATAQNLAIHLHHQTA